MSSGQDAVITIREEQAKIGGVEVAAKTVPTATTDEWQVCVTCIYTSAPVLSITCTELRLSEYSYRYQRADIKPFSR